MYSILGGFTRAEQEKYETTKYGKLLSVHTAGINELSEDTAVVRSNKWYDNMLVYIIDGAVVVEMGDRSFTAEVGDIVILPSHTAYKIFSNPYCRWYWVHFHSSIPYSDFGIPDSDKFNINSSMHLKNELNRLIKECNNIDYNTQQLCTCIFMGILFSIGRMYKQTENDIRFVDSVDYAIKSMTVNEASKGYIREYAAMAGCNEIKFRAECKKRTGMTPKQYILHRRKLRIMRDMENFNGSLQEYAQALGFEQYSYFCKFVKKHLGMSPENYIKAINKEKYKSNERKE